MIWFTWRQYRTEALIVIIVLLLVTSILLITGMHIASFAHQLGNKIGNPGCVTDTCTEAQFKLKDYIEQNAFGNGIFYSVFQTLLLALPVILGMFVGVQVVAPELEQGTYRLIWTQSIAWSRWLRIKISALLVCLLVGMGLLMSVLLWWKIPALSSSISFWGRENYDVWSMTAIAYTLFALALGICAGTVLKKTVPAMAVTLVIFVVVRLLIAVYLRPSFLPPMVKLTPLLSNAQTSPAQTLFIKEDYVDRQGNRFDLNSGICKNPGAGSSEPAPSRAMLQWNMALPLMNITLPKGEMGGPRGPETPTAAQTAQVNAYNQCIMAHGVQTKDTYQPADRFWLFQEIESGIYVVLSALLLAFTFWWTRSRIIGTQR